MVKENKKLDWILIATIVIVLFSVFLFVFVLNLNNFLSLEIKKISIAVDISNYSALNLEKNQTVLHLGSVKKGASGIRKVAINNDYNFTTVFEFEVKGNITDLLVYPKQVLFEPLEDKEVTFRTKIIEDEEFGEYSGIIIVRIKKLIE
jgi:hypothetical protein